jgi:Uncharacterized protein conserved in bacteria (DUF2200)
LTGFDSRALKKHLKEETTFKDFFKGAKLHPNAQFITGTICGVKIEAIEDPLIKKSAAWTNWLMSSPRGAPWRKSFAPASRPRFLPDCCPGTGLGVCSPNFKIDERSLSKMK